MKDIDRLLRDALKAEGDAYEPSNPDAAEREFMQKRGRRRMVRTGGAGLLAAAAAVAVFALVQPEAVSDRNERGLQPASLQVADRFTVAEEPLAIAGAPSGIWIASREGGTVTRIDPSTGATEEVALEGANELAVGDAYAWVGGAEGRTVRIDVQTLDITGDLANNAGASIVDMAVGGHELGAAWMIDETGCLIDLTNPGPNHECIAMDPPGFSATDVATAPNETWLLDGDTGGLDQFHAGPGLNEGRGVVDGEAALPTAPAGQYSDLLITTDGNDALWVSGEGGQLMRLDLVTGEETVTRLAGDYADLAAGYGSVWALVGHEGSDRGELVAIDVATGEPIGAPYSLSGKPSDVYAGVDGVWVTLRERNEVVRIVRPDAEPVPVETAEATPAPDETPPASAGRPAIVFSQGGDIWASDENGALTQLTDTQVAEGRPAFTKSIFDSEGYAVVFERGRSGSGTDLVYLDLSTMEESEIRREAAWATFWPDHMGAWLDRVEGGPQISIGPLFSEPIDSFSVVGTSDPYSVGPIAWDQNNEILFYALAERSGPEIYLVDVATNNGSPVGVFEPKRLDVPGLNKGDVLVAPTLSFSLGLDVIRLSDPSSSSNDGSFKKAELGTVEMLDSGNRYSPLVDLSDLPLELASARLTLAQAGELAVEVGDDGSVRWSRGDIPSWLVGDGARLFLVDTTGAVQELPFEVGIGAAVAPRYLRF